MTSFFHEEDTKIALVAPDIYCKPFLSQEFCSLLVSLATSNELGWTVNVRDKYYSTVDYMLQIQVPEIFSSIKEELSRVVWPELADEWSLDELEVSQAFIVHYSLNKQLSLKEHTDTSYVSCAIKLNDKYEGAELVFPRQGFTTKDIPIGDIIIWPSKLTHPHYVTQLKSGEKFSLILWTDEK